MNNPNTTGSMNVGSVGNLGNVSHLIAGAPVGLFAPLMYSILYAGAIQTFGEKEYGYSHEQINDNAAKLVAAIWPNFWNGLTTTFQLPGQIGGNVNATQRAVA